MRLQAWEVKESTTTKQRRACAEVVGIVKRAWRPLVCVLEPDSAIGNQYLVEPLDVRFPKINICTRQVGGLGQTKDVVLGWLGEVLRVSQA